MLRIYTDGACSPNPGKGGWAAVAVERDQIIGQISGSVLVTTSNRMEILSAIQGLMTFGGRADLEVVSDSKYLVDAIVKGWIDKWKRTGWKTVESTPVKNRDLWEQIDGLRAGAQFRWEKGHGFSRFNLLCDELAVMARLEQKSAPVEKDEFVWGFGA